MARRGSRSRNSINTSGAWKKTQKRDHRKLGKELKLFVISDELPAGVPMFLPNGEMLRYLMESYVRETQEKYGYQHVWTSHLGKVKLYKTSRHWYNYRENMFPSCRASRNNRKTMLLCSSR